LLALRDTELVLLIDDHEARFVISNDGVMSA